MTTQNELFEALNPPQRLLMGPGPINAYPRVHQAISQALIGQYDPVMTGYMNQVQSLYRGVFQTQNQQTLLVDGTARSGIEAVLVSVLKPGDKVLVPVIGRFGHLLCEIAQRVGAKVQTIDIEWGEVCPPEKVEAAIKAFQPKLLATVQGDTSTTMNQPLKEMGEICQRHGVLFYCDATASIAGNDLKVDEWNLDAVSAGLQKCLGGPSGSAPITLSDHCAERINRRKHVEAGIRADHHTQGDEVMIQSNYFDLAMIMDYWGPERLNHHTEATSMLYAARECARIFLEEGADNVIARHKQAGEALAAGLRAMGLELFGNQTYKMNNVVGVYIPANVNGDAIRLELLQRFGIEIGTSFGPLHGKIWRIGTMGYNARQECVLSTLAALEAILIKHKAVIVAGQSVIAAMEFYA
ncbi:pyridoxal-phosphate-dependent aminotransferase family protein [Vibrio cincinnatiensis]|uniref:pyridoxal-phosphate-dependent aminotransferase family protein n=1 Tax=Vibrio cincinnatiensis TaxID=675 RepID=UPI001EDF4C27|nr:alanine--glyoxylate aminotransferase family protein [Vibrio cincinnatiensis]MCG3732587.1 alanine--glyoxylate aminotransferase family protein [Vibrio cincinnatiensis]MCG3740898.1 alanine--glyoxylate aminotransferase family protein [Vibrio cincinnatiensis]MCG3742905.1 alanine--glyoxylate aminotransferase family protein [Vibrio cincinnatiensis]